MSITSTTRKQEALSGRADEEAVLFAPLRRTRWTFWPLAALLLLITAGGVVVTYRQFSSGLGVTGLNFPVYWGTYIINTVFFISISYGATLVAAILHVLRVKWRTPITRAAQVLAVCSVAFGALNIILDMGRPDRVWHIILYGRFESPILWDFCAISLYTVCSVVFLYLALITDLAELKERCPRRRWFYRVLSLGWAGTGRQEKRLGRIRDVLAVVMIVLAVLADTAIAYLLSVNTQPMWHSTIMGAHFVVGALYSGVAAVVIVLAVLRSCLGLAPYIKAQHFNYLGLVMLVMAPVWLYFTSAEYITAYYGQEPSHIEVAYANLFGEFAPYFWAQVALCLVLPVLLLSWRRIRAGMGAAVAGVSVLVGMWLERLLIIVPTLTRPRLPADLPFTTGIYRPTSTEWVVTAASAAAVALLYLVFIKLFPILPICEIRKERGRQAEEGGTDQPGDAQRGAASPRPELVA